MANLPQEFRDTEQPDQRAVVVSTLNADRSAGRRTTRSGRRAAMQTILAAAAAGSPKTRCLVNAHVACYMLAFAWCLWPEHLNAQAQAASPQEYRTTADQQTVLKSDLVSVPGKEG